MTGVVMPAKPPFARERAQVGIAFMICLICFAPSALSANVNVKKLFDFFLPLPPSLSAAGVRFTKLEYLILNHFGRVM